MAWNCLTLLASRDSRIHADHGLYIIPLTRKFAGNLFVLIGVIVVLTMCAEVFLGEGRRHTMKIMATEPTNASASLSATDSKR